MPAAANLELPVIITLLDLDWLRHPSAVLWTESLNFLSFLRNGDGRSALAATPKNTVARFKLSIKQQHLGRGCLKKFHSPYSPLKTAKAFNSTEILEFTSQILSSQGKERARPVKQSLGVAEGRTSVLDQLLGLPGRPGQQEPARKSKPQQLSQTPNQQTNKQARRATLVATF